MAVKFICASIDAQAIETVMPVNTPSKPPAPVLDNPAENKFDPHRPDMPDIPGIEADAERPRSPFANLDPNLIALVGGITVGVLVIIVSIFWWAKIKPQATADASAAATDASEPAVPTLPLPVTNATAQEGPTEVGKIDQLDKDWAAKKFTFVRPFTHENVDAMVIRLPGGELWGFAVQSPYGRCELEFVTDLNRLATDFGYHASHPMVVSPCDRTVFDPLKIGSLGGDTWARGEIVHGSALRPPIGINVKVIGSSVFADRIE
jgi:hypothetical protein